MIETSQPTLLRIARGVVHDPSLVEDAVQITFIIAIEKAPHFDDNCRLTPWLIGILQRVAGELRRSASRTPDPKRIAELVQPEPVDRTITRETNELVQRAIDGLPRPYREVVRLHIYEELPPNEIAQQLHRPGSTVRNQLARGLRFLRGKIAE